MSTTRTRSALLTWGVVLSSSVLAVTACTGDPVATGTVPLTSSVMSPVTPTDAIAPEKLRQPLNTATSTEILPSVTDSSEEVPSSNNSTTSATSTSDPIVVTASTQEFTAPASPLPPTLEVPAGAFQNTVGGASDFILWWLRLGVASIEASDSSVLALYSSPSCGDCQSLIRRVDESIVAGERVSQEEGSWAEVMQADVLSEDAIAVVLFSYAGARKVLSSDGSILKTEPSNQTFVGLDLSWTGQHWVVGQSRKLTFP